MHAILSSTPFLYEPKGNMPVTSAQAAELVEHHGAHCHQFGVNNAHQSPDIATLAGMIDDFAFTPADGEAFLMQNILRHAKSASAKGAYGVAAGLGVVRSDVMHILHLAQNERYKGSPHEYGGHAEELLVEHTGIAYLQSDTDHTGDVMGVNLCPCPGCMKSIIECKMPTTVIGSIDPKTGASFLRGEQLQYAVGMPKQQVIEKLGLQFRFPIIGDAQTRALIMTLCWEVFHATRQRTHTANYGVTLKE